MDLKHRFDKFNRSLKTTYCRVNESSGGILEVIPRALSNFTEQRGAETAASLAYYTFFSIFPMLLVFIVIGSFFVDKYVVIGQTAIVIQRTTLVGQPAVLGDAEGCVIRHSVVSLMGQLRVHNHWSQFYCAL